MNAENTFARKIRLSLVALTGVLLLAGVSLSAQRRTSGKGFEVSVMSFNIRYGTANDGANHWRNRRGMVCDVIARGNPDVIGLQEALLFQIDEIRRQLPKYNLIGVGRDDGKTKGEYSGILFRNDKFKIDQGGTFWLSDTPEVPGSITWGNACTRICTWARFVEKATGRAFYLYNVHLDHISQPSREKSMVLLTRRIRDRKKPDPFIVTGDFNAGEDNPAISFLKAKTTLAAKDNARFSNPAPMVDTFRVLHPDATNVGTFNGFKGTSTGAKIDYILTTSGVKVLNAKILHDNEEGQYPSDHFPVTAHLLLLVEKTAKIGREMRPLFLRIPGLSSPAAGRGLIRSAGTSCAMIHPVSAQGWS